MSVSPTASEDEVSSPDAPRLTALVYPQNSYPATAFEALVAACRSSDLSLAGVLQHVVDAAPERRCDVVLEDLATGRRTPIFEYRGAGAAGCRLDEAALADVAARIEASLDAAPDVLILNKFGKAECEGNGLLDLVGRAMQRNVAVVIGVPQGNLAAWRDFAGRFAVELPPDRGAIDQWLERLRHSRQSG
ncbi:DUF2478 domain-containing protein [Bradyrhizobium monzae]|uniref:DUF2478 domain-containing protein n=1 Tax=Bradyrhizobium sp. Oc8 TaxID=2876780 RepID=UPI001F1DCA0F|nr:DUF2478 domain-containing protein [Bradyrhizobium sp. Oc8]